MENRTIAQVIAEIEATLVRCEAMVAELAGNVAEPAEESGQEAASEERLPEWDSFEALKEGANDVCGQLVEWREAFFARNAQGRVLYARNAIRAIRANVSLLARRISLATCIKPGVKREKALCSLFELSDSLGKISACLDGLISEWNGDKMLSQLARLGGCAVGAELSKSQQLAWDVCSAFNFGRLKAAA